MKTLLRSLLTFYGARLPYHPGKWRVVEAILHHASLVADHPSEATEVQRRGLRWMLREDCVIQRSLRFLGVYEREETRYLESWWKPGMTVLDIGANFGYYGILAGKRVGDSGSVISFEPYPPNRQQLQVNRDLNGLEQLHIESRALSDEAGTVSFIVPPVSCLGVGRIAVSDEVKGDRVEVETLTLDAFAEDAELEQLDFIKLDVEGAETRVVRGGRKTLSRFKPLMLVEINPEGLEEFGSSPQELVSLFNELGYGLFRLNHGKMNALPIGPGVDFVRLFGDHGNTFAIPLKEK